MAVGVDDARHVPYLPIQTSDTDLFIQLTAAAAA